MAIERQIIQQFLNQAGKRLRGDWVLLGGTVLPALGVSTRPTLDIDIAGPPDADQGQMLILMEIADSLGLPVEAINQAAAFFLRRMDDYKEHLIPLVKTEQCTIYRPDATLFIRMKLQRLSAKDLQDCLLMISFARQRGEALDVDILKQQIAALRAEGSHSVDRLERATELERVLTSPWDGGRSPGSA